MSTTVDILAIGAHPDDVELCCGGTLLRHMALGYSAGIVDLTQGELGTRGSGELRLKEAQQAAQILGIERRENLGLKDGFFADDEETRLKIISAIRSFRPSIVLTNAVRDRHPDHGRASSIVSTCCFLSGLTRIRTEKDGKSQEAWKPRAVYHYIQDRYIPVDLAVDITPFMDKKMEAILAFKSQFFNPDSKEPETTISSPDFLENIKARSRDVGRQIGVTFAEGFIAERFLGVNDLMEIL